MDIYKLIKKCYTYAHQIHYTHTHTPKHTSTLFPVINSSHIIILLSITGKVPVHIINNIV